jgi:hypothetical protein
MSSIVFNLNNYRQVVDLADNIAYSNSRVVGRMNIHQTINFLIYHIQVALGEILVKSRPGIWNRIINKPIDIYWHYTGRCNRIIEEKFIAKEFLPSSFTTDRNTLVMKLRKFIMQPDDMGQSHHPLYGHLSKEEYVLLILRMIDFYLKPFASGEVDGNEVNNE